MHTRHHHAATHAAILTIAAIATISSTGCVKQRSGAKPAAFGPVESKSLRWDSVSVSVNTSAAPAVFDFDVEGSGTEAAALVHHASKANVVEGRVLSSQPGVLLDNGWAYVPPTRRIRVTPKQLTLGPRAHLQPMEIMAEASQSQSAARVYVRDAASGETLTVCLRSATQTCVQVGKGYYAEWRMVDGQETITVLPIPSSFNAVLDDVELRCRTALGL